MENKEGLEVRLRRIKRERKVRRMGNRISQQMWTNSIAKEIIDNGALVTYIRDKWGFKKGVVLATGPGQLGWSLVSPQDYVYTKVGIEQVPAFAAFIHCLDEADRTCGAFIHNPLFKQWATTGGWINKPLFDRAIGITVAADRARAYAATEPIGQGIDFGKVPLPNDKEFLDALARMNLRSYRYFSDSTATAEDEPK